MKTHPKHLIFPVVALTLLSSALLAGCGQEQPKTIIAKPAGAQHLRAASLTGAVSNNSGPIKSGEVKLRSEAGKLIASTELNNSPRFEIPVPANTPLPLILSYGSGADELVSVIIHPDSGKYDITPTTTAIAKQAKAMGGYSHGNMVRAAEETAHVPDANKTTSGFRGDPTTQYGGWH